MKSFIKEYVKPFGVAYLITMGIILTAVAIFGTCGGIFYLIVKVVNP